MSCSEKVTKCKINARWQNDFKMMQRQSNKKCMCVVKAKEASKVL